MPQTNSLLVSPNIRPAGSSLEGVVQKRCVVFGRHSHDSLTDGFLTESAQSWACVRDNVTGRVWEMKTDDNSVHDKDNTYRWGGYSAQGKFYGSYYTDWNALLDWSNYEALCGFTDWRVPTRFELAELANLNRINPSIDTAFFPHTFAATFWSASPIASDSINAWRVDFATGSSSPIGRGNDLRVRLVRAGQ